MKATRMTAAPIPPKATHRIPMGVSETHAREQPQPLPAVALAIARCLGQMNDRPGFEVRRHPGTGERRIVPAYADGEDGMRGYSIWRSRPPGFSYSNT